VVGRGGIGPHTLPTVNKVGWSSCAGSCFAASGMTFFIGFVARYDIGGLLRGHHMSGARPIKKVIPDTARQIKRVCNMDENEV